MKRLGLARSVITAAFVTAAFLPAANAAGSFSNMYTFGDSLSDVGTEDGLFPGAVKNNHWTYNNAPLWDQYIAAQYGLTLTPANPDNPNIPAGGNAYAQGGAQAFGPGDSGGLYPGVGEPVTTQVANYLKASGGKADPNALYTVWIGGNDVAPALAAGQSGGTAAAQAYMTKAAAVTVGEVQALQAAGAQHILVANVPNVGQTPELFNSVTNLVAQGFYAGVNNSATATLIASKIAGAIGQGSNATLVNYLAGTIQQGTAASGSNPLSNAAAAAAQSQLNAGTGAYSTAAVQAAGRAAESAIAQSYANVVAQSVTPVLQGALIQSFMAQGLSQAQATAAANAELAQIGPALPGALTPTLLSLLSGQVYSNFQTAQYAAGQVVNSVFNPVESAGLNKSGVIYIDVNKLLNEVFANPKLYGFDNVTGYACPSGTPANDCTSSSAGFDSSKQFFFADDLHPSPAATKAVYQYMYSVLQAPYFAAQLANAQQTSVFASEGALDNREFHARSINSIDLIANVSHLDNKFDAGTDYLASTNNNTAVTFGADIQVAKNYSLGAAVTQVKSSTNLGSNGNFNTSDYLMSIFSRADWGPITLSDDVFFGSTRFSTINRTFAIGADNRVETGTTSGSQAGLRIVGSYAFNFGKITLSPTVSAAYREGKIGGYVESSNDSSTSSNMQYNQQRIDSTVLGAGVKFDGEYGQFKPYASAIYYGEVGSKKRTVTAGITGESTTFDTVVQNPDHSYTQLNLGMHYDFTKRFTAYAAYSYSAGLTDQKRDTWNVGLQASF